MFKIDTSSKSDSLKVETKQNNSTLIPKWVGGKINWPGQLTPTPATKHTEQSDKENR